MLRTEDKEGHLYSTVTHQLKMQRNRRCYKNEIIECLICGSVSHHSEISCQPS